MSDKERAFIAKVEGIAQGGRGVVRHDGLAVFIPGVVPNELVSVDLELKKKSYAEGRLIHVIEPSPDRIVPRCKHYSECGGCQFQHMSYGAQVSAKKQLVIDAFLRIAKLSPLPKVEIFGAKSLWGYRRHIRLKLWPKNPGFDIGFMGSRDEFVPIDRCHIFIDEEDSDLLKKLRNLVLNLESKSIKEARVSILKNGASSSVLFFEFEPRLPNNARHLIESALAKRSFFCGAILADGSSSETLGNTEANIRVGDLDFIASPDAFLQNNQEMSERIYLDLIDTLRIIKKDGPALEILDLYSGIGITSILLSKEGFLVTAVELSKKALALAQRNADYNQVKVLWMGFAAEDAIGRVIEGKDIVIMNPPRTGIKPAVLEAIKMAKPHHLFYISCMPPTLARDIKILAEGGYEVRSCKAYDMFPQTTHVETLVHLSSVD